MICALCLEEKQPRPNTHYFSDFLIKNALNEDGKSDREKGMYWSIDTESPTVDFNFQRNASPIKLEKLFGRQTTDEENEKSKSQIIYSVNDKFCTRCEDKFGTIETAFQEQVLPKFRGANLENVTQVQLSVDESRAMRLFALLQIWRGYICEEDILLSDEVADYLRGKIFNEDNTDLEEIPLSATYLETSRPEGDVNGDAYKTGNSILVNHHANINHLLLNDFLFQQTEHLHVPFDEFFGFNTEDDYVDLFNYQSPSFDVKIIPDSQRRIKNYNYHSYTAKKLMATTYWTFLDNYTLTFKKLPSDREVATFMSEVANSEDMLRFTDERLREREAHFFKRVKNEEFRN
ncbi:MAG: hypothetical protein EOO50_13295 [Flavobacterium sp.]|uniref:hypothetical protein n=1 Tax=Flavobacterium sp. TaxID=239 RepID=UPI001228BF1E|nr:hypothetical protein [Flavobacterium sp.]RZJ65619.1 MAG: hypothetical protein EOO50_13295 [Flavobacterium sp.]